VISSEELPPLSSTDESESPLSDAIKDLSNSEVEWRGTTFGHAGPKLVGPNVRIIFKEGVGVSGQLLPLLENDESFIAAHVLLTELWRVSEEEKSRQSTTTRDGYSINYNGLKMKLEWKEESGMIIKTTNISDPSSQRQRLMNWWKSRFRDHPSEFSIKTFVE
jgi:hypothetical protein